MTIWFDTSDLQRFYQAASRPTGIQRLNFEALAALATHEGVRFCHRQSGFRETDFPALAARIRTAGSLVSPPRVASSPGMSWLAQRARQLPPDLRLPLGSLGRAGAQSAAALRDLARASLAYARPAKRVEGAPVAFAAGDWLINLGASWDFAYNKDEMQALRARGTKIGLFVHDLIAALHPEWCTKGTIADISTWLRDIVPQADLLFANSRQTQADFATVMGPQARIPVVLPLGAAPSTPPGAPENYVLVVGTLEVRKNHAALLPVWRRLLATLPAASVPDLVFAGKPGWLTGDFLAQLDNANWLEQKIKFIQNPSEPELTRLYQQCRFTLFPSLYEGFGLPVTESLSFGKTVAASDRPAIREAGGEFCAYFDPENITSVTETVRGLLDPVRVAELEARIAQEYRPASWGDTASEIMKCVG
jgi:glycosyltransferase involved in cell wall biosynthesis